jgi:hypothetical protein
LSIKSGQMSGIWPPPDFRYPAFGLAGYQYPAKSISGASLNLSTCFCQIHLQNYGMYGYQKQSPFSVNLYVYLQYNDNSCLVLASVEYRHQQRVNLLGQAKAHLESYHSFFRQFCQQLGHAFLLNHVSRCPETNVLPRFELCTFQKGV